MGPTGLLIGSQTAQLQAFAQSVYKMIKNRYYDDLTSADGQTYLSEVVDWLNEFIDELETEINADGEPIDWIWVRRPGTTLGVATYTDGKTLPSIAWDSTDYNNLCVGTERFVQILNPTDSTQSVANFTVVAPDEMSNDSRRNTIDMCTLVNGNIYFSRPFRQEENGGTIIGDVTTYLPRVTTTINPTTSQIMATNTDIFKTVKPLTLLKLGTVKNAILPDIVMGGLNPSYTQKYNDLLTNAINQSTRSAVSPTADYDDLGGIGGIGF
jgi:hypothetical protein